MGELHHMALPVDYTKQIQTLLSENEFLQLQLEDLNNAVRQKDEEINILGDSMDSAALLQSRIDGNLREIEQLRFNLTESEKKTVGAEILNEELEITLLKEIRENQKKEAELKGLDSMRTELEIVTIEMNDAVSLYKIVQQLRSELSEAKSKADLLAEENTELRSSLVEMQELITLLRKQRADS